MALTTCSECGKSISQKATTCPNCGAPMKKKASFIKRLIIFTLALTFFIAIFSAKESQNKSVPTNKKASEAPAKPTPKQEAPIADMDDTEFLNQYFSRIGEYALMPYTATATPNIFRTYQARLDEIEELRLQAAKKALLSGKCDKVINAELSQQSSIDDLKFFVVCENKQRFDLKESDIITKTVARTNTDRLMKSGDAILACGNLIKREVADKIGELDLHTFTGTGYRVPPGALLAMVSYNFDFKNAFGVEMQYTAHCRFPLDGPGEIQIVARQR